MERGRFLMIGIDQAGKTSVLYWMKFRKRIKTVPTFGFNVETICGTDFSFGDEEISSFDIWDVGGANRTRAFWTYYYRGMCGIIFVVDASQKERILESAEALKSVISDEKTKNVSLLVLVNKIDLHGCMSKQEIAGKLKIKDIQNRKVKVLEISTVNGKGMDEVVKWLSSTFSESDYVKGNIQ
jgi:small GTP-binding protein